MNKSSSYHVLSITVTRKTPSTVTYTLAHGLKNKPFSWGATTGHDRMIIDQLEVGQSYFIRTATDQHGTQHWTEARLLSRGKLTSDPITQAVAKARSKPQIRKDFLDDVLEW